MASFFEFQQKLRAPPSRAGGQGKAGGGGEPLTVSQLTKRIDRLLQTNLPEEIRVRGEVSNYKHHGASGHKYFTLKDVDTCLDCVMFKGDGVQLKFTPADGMELVATGRIKVYGAKGKYQLYVTAMEPLGQGALELAFRQLYAKLEAEGLFRAERKKVLPKYPSRVVLVTSRQTAALADMLKVLRRFSWVRVCLYHVPVQGDGAAERMAEAISHLGRCGEQLGGGGVILLARGGGSLEDLWEFNEEVLARAMAACPIPIVTGIGHEVDTSIADLVADHHAHTPTEAAQVVTVHWRSARDAIDAGWLRLGRCVRQVIGEARQRLAQVERHEAFRRPLDRVNSLRQLLDDRQRALSLGLTNHLRELERRVRELEGGLRERHPVSLILRLRERVAGEQQRLTAALGRRLRARHEWLGRLAGLMVECHPRHELKLHRQRLELLARRFDRSIATDVRRRREAVESLAVHLTAVGPEQVLRRGYTITRLKKGGAIVRSKSQVRAGDRLLTRLPDGEVESTAEDPRQPRLFE